VSENPWTGTVEVEVMGREGLKYFHPRLGCWLYWRM